MLLFGFEAADFNMSLSDHCRGYNVWILHVRKFYKIKKKIIIFQEKYARKLTFSRAGKK
jgi:hypothetical protein